MPATANPRDEFLAELVGKLKDVRGAILTIEGGEDSTTEKPLPTVYWATALRCVIESARMRKGSAPGSRFYLDFLSPFIADATRE